MRKIIFRKTFIIAALLVSILAKAQTSGTHYEGDVLAGFVGKGINSQEIKDLLAGYTFEKVNDQHYISKDGIELVFKDGNLDEIHLYQDNFQNGSFKGQLPKKLKFGLSTTEVKQVLGTPKLWYNNGYGEFQFDGYVLSCWFENNILNQVVIGTKGS